MNKKEMETKCDQQSKNPRFKRKKKILYSFPLYTLYNALHINIYHKRNIKYNISTS